MARELIITMTAANRMGILAAVTRAMSDLGADLYEASQTVVRGYFTMIFSAQFPDTLSKDVVSQHLADAGRPFDIDVNVKNGPEVDVVGGNQTQTVHAIRLVVENRPGLLRNLSTTMAKQEVDILGMRAVQTLDGGFEMHMKVSVDSEGGIERLLAEANKLGQSDGFSADLSD